jgi:exopolysaccharide/PEP-CTERM locus tyrosine autokinase
MSRIEQAIDKATKMRKKGEEEKTSEREPSETASGAFAADVSIKPDNSCIVTITEPNSAIAEEYRKLKSMVVKLTTKGNFFNTLMVTSTVAGEGKSITSLNLAVTLASEYDHTVLLIDADFRQPSIHRLLGIGPSIGLSDCLTNGADIGKALVKTGIGNLVFLPSGSSIGDPVELLSSKKLRELLKEIKHRYGDRYVILDTPPILPFAEVHSLSSLVDGVVFVVREGMAPLESIKEALGLLKDSNVLGVVYNDATIDVLDAHSRYYHYNKVLSREIRQ